MDDRRFDSLTRALANGASRRSVLKGLLGLGGATAIGGSVLEGDTEAARRRTPTPKPHTCPGIQHWDGSKCVCPDNLWQCNPGTGPTCCESEAACCDNACCNDPYQCVAEETCCLRLPQVGCLDDRGRCCTTLCVITPGEVECCSADAFCPGGSEDPDLCCGGDTPQRCDCGTSDNHCIPTGKTCCTEDADCGYLNTCDGLTWHHFVCGSGGYCVDSPVDCNDSKPCTADTCNAQTGCGNTTACTDPGECEKGPGSCNESGQCVYPPICSGDRPDCCIDEELGPYCVDTQTDNANCGNCGNVCTGNDTCSGGGTTGQCGCTPTFTPANCDSVPCGDYPNGCGASVICGCGNGYICRDDHVCVVSSCTADTIGDPCNPPEGAGGQGICQSDLTCCVPSDSFAGGDPGEWCSATNCCDGVCSSITGMCY